MSVLFPHYLIWLNIHQRYSKGASYFIWVDEKVGNDHKRSRRQLGLSSGPLVQHINPPGGKVSNRVRKVRWLDSSETNQIETLADSEYI